MNHCELVPRGTRDGSAVLRHQPELVGVTLQARFPRWEGREQQSGLRRMPVAAPGRPSYWVRRVRRCRGGSETPVLVLLCRTPQLGIACRPGPLWVQAQLTLNSKG